MTNEEQHADEFASEFVHDNAERQRLDLIAQCRIFLEFERSPMCTLINEWLRELEKMAQDELCSNRTMTESEVFAKHAALRHAKYVRSFIAGKIDTVISDAEDLAAQHDMDLAEFLMKVEMLHGG